MCIYIYIYGFYAICNHSNHLSYKQGAAKLLNCFKSRICKMFTLAVSC